MAYYYKKSVKVYHLAIINFLVANLTEFECNFSFLQGELKYFPFFLNNIYTTEDVSIDCVVCSYFMPCHNLKRKYIDNNQTQLQHNVLKIRYFPICL